MPSRGALGTMGAVGRGPSSVYLRVTTPANLDLALEGLVRKVLREQPKQEEIYSFAADYFETLLEIRDKAEIPNMKADDICPNHTETEANELIKLATSFAKPAFLLTAAAAPVVGEELCSVVDVDNIPKISADSPSDASEIENVHEELAKEGHAEVPESSSQETSESTKNEQGSEGNQDGGDKETEMGTNETAEMSQGLTETQTTGEPQNYESSEGDDVKDETIENNGDQKEENETETTKTLSDKKDVPESEGGLTADEIKIEEKEEEYKNNIKESDTNVTAAEGVDNDSSINTVEKSKDESKVIDEGVQMVSEKDDSPGDPVFGDESNNTGATNKNTEKAEENQEIESKLTEEMESSGTANPSEAEMSEKEIPQPTIEESEQNKEEDNSEENMNILDDDNESHSEKKLDDSETVYGDPNQVNTTDNKTDSADESKENLENAEKDDDDIPPEVKDEVAENNPDPNSAIIMSEAGIVSEVKPINDLSSAIITAETTEGEAGESERDIIKEFIDREKVFSAMGNSTRSIEVAEVHQEEVVAETLEETIVSNEAVNEQAEIEQTEISATHEEPTSLKDESDLKESAIVDSGLIGGVTIQNNDENIKDIGTESVLQAVSGGILGGVIVGAPIVASLGSENVRESGISESKEGAIVDSGLIGGVTIQNNEENINDLGSERALQVSGGILGGVIAGAPLIANVVSENDIIAKSSADLNALEENVAIITEESKENLEETIEESTGDLQVELATPNEENTDLLKDETQADLTQDKASENKTENTGKEENSRIEESVDNFDSTAVYPDSENKAQPESRKKRDISEQLSDELTQSLLEEKDSEGTENKTTEEVTTSETEENNKEIKEQAAELQVEQNNEGSSQEETKIENKNEQIIEGDTFVRDMPEEVTTVSDVPAEVTQTGVTSYEAEENSSMTTMAEETGLLNHLTEVAQIASMVTNEVIEEATKEKEKGADGNLEGQGTVDSDAQEKNEETPVQSKDESESSKDTESSGEENPFISAEVKMLVQPLDTTVSEVDSEYSPEDETDVVVPLNAEIGTIEEADEGQWATQLALVRAAMTIQKNFRKYLQRKREAAENKVTVVEETEPEFEDDGKSLETQESTNSSLSTVQQNESKSELSRSYTVIEAPTTHSFSNTKEASEKEATSRTKSFSTSHRAVDDSEVWSTLEQELDSAASTIQSGYKDYRNRQRLRREDAVQIPSEESPSGSPKMSRLMGTGELHDIIVPEEN